MSARSHLLLFDAPAWFLCLVHFHQPHGCLQYNGTRFSFSVGVAIMFGTIFW